MIRARPPGPTVVTFYPAAEHHQDNCEKSPVRAKFNRYNSGRDQFLEGVWGKESK